MEELTIHQANSGYLTEIKKILRSHNLPNDDIDDHIDNFIVAKINGSVIGVIGVQFFNKLALLRSFGVINNYQHSGIGTILYNEMLKKMKNQLISEVFLLTISAESYFLKKGFNRIHRNIVPQKIKKSHEFKYACPSSAVCMKIILS